MKAGVALDQLEPSLDIPRPMRVDQTAGAGEEREVSEGDKCLCRPPSAKINYCLFFAFFDKKHLN